MFNKEEFAIDSNLWFISRTNFMLSWVEHEKSLITSGPEDTSCCLCQYLFLYLPQLLHFCHVFYHHSWDLFHFISEQTYLHYKTYSSNVWSRLKVKHHINFFIGHKSRVNKSPSNATVPWFQIRSRFWFDVLATSFSNRSWNFHILFTSSKTHGIAHHVTYSK